MKDNQNSEPRIITEEVLISQSELREAFQKIFTAKESALILSMAYKAFDEGRTGENSFGPEETDVAGSVYSKVICALPEELSKRAHDHIQNLGKTPLGMPKWLDLSDKKGES